MAILIKLLGDYAPYLYGLAAIVALFLLRAAILARRDRMQATFSLEREAARNREFRVMFGAFLLIVFMGGVYGLNRYVVPNVAIPYRPTVSPTPLFLPTVTPTGGIPTPTATATPIVFDAPTPAGEGVETETPTPQTSEAVPTPEPPTAVPAPQYAAPACSNPGVQLTSPGVGAQVQGAVGVNGTASIENFQFYKVEIGVGTNPGGWSFLFSGESPVSGGRLGQFDAGGLAAGTYTLRLVVVDLTGNFPDPCQTIINVVH